MRRVRGNVESNPGHHQQKVSAVHAEYASMHERHPQSLKVIQHKSATRKPGGKSA